MRLSIFRKNCLPGELVSGVVVVGVVVIVVVVVVDVVPGVVVNISVYSRRRALINLAYIELSFRG